MRTRTYIFACLLIYLSTHLLSCTSKPTVCFFGSSVCNGVGAEQQHGYAWQVAQNLPEGWLYENISVNGNNTFDLFARFERDLTPSKAKYVVLGVSLGNEGLHEKDARALLSYRENMPRLIKMIQDEGRVAIVCNNYSRADFNEADFQDLCEVNLEVQQWNVPTINLLGNIDDGHGHWATGFWDGEDKWHPNTAGHTQMASAFVPSMWEALEQGKPLPERLTSPDPSKGGGSYTDGKIVFTAEAGLCSYTLSYMLGDTVYTEVYSALRNEMTRYINKTQVACDKEERQQTFTLPANITQLLFYRAALTPLEVEAIVEGKMLRSSLEIYCPLVNGDTHNYAQSLNTIHIINP